METAATSQVCQFRYAAVAMDFDEDGNCYIVDMDGWLCRADITTGAEIESINENTGVTPVNASSGSVFPQCGAVMGNWFVWVAIDYSISEFNQIKLLAINLNDGALCDLGPAYVSVTSGNLYYWPKCVFGFENEPVEIPDSSIDPVDFYDNFEALTFDWETVDADGDGKTWEVKYWDDGLYQDGSRAAVSYSWQNEVLYPDNYMISAPIEIGQGEKYLSYFASSANTGAGADIDEHWQVIVIPEGYTYENGIVVEETTMTTANVTEHLIDMSDYTGETVQIAFRHFNCSDEYTLIIDSVGIGDRL
jgi:hypothetical protein